MREIKFRAWLIEEREMLNNGDWLTIDPCSPNPVIQYADQGWYVNSANAEGGYLERLQNNNIKPKDEFILMQFTGLYDKNGKEIYEGDIVKWIKYNSASGTGKIIYDSDDAEFRIMDIEGWTMADKSVYYTITIICTTHTLEVIGNIYENPDLI
jgi:uncharacterized phage protein (TIGR01671 family)